jgi:AraC family transcriptional regulator
MLMEHAPARALPVHLTAIPPARIVRRERRWLDLLEDDNNNAPIRDLAASRWTGFAKEAREEASEIDPDCHLLGITLRPMDFTVFAAEKLLHDGYMRQGMMRVIEPGLPVRGVFRGGYDTLHLHIRNAVITECVEAGRGSSRLNAADLASFQPSSDPVIERLAHALIHADDFGGAFGQCYADSVGLAIVARLLGRHSDRAPSRSDTRGSGLSKWRLKRATDYVAAHLSEPISLAQIAASAGLTRMHFAAQFKATTGMRPHEYLIQQRIQRAQELLVASCMPLAEVALEVGFKSQAHFTTVFAKVVGQTPNVWRQQNYAGSVAH